MTEVVPPSSAGRSARPSHRRPGLTLEPTIVAESPSMRRAVELARRFAPMALPVLLVGETGTGKEVLAQAIHRWSGRRGELVDVDCGALPQGMVVAELFGHRKGAYTTAVDSMPGLIEQSANGTLFLDELASLGAEAQAALLRVLETGEVRRVGDRTKHRLDLRLIAAIQDQDSGTGAEDGLRRDLYHRLAGTVIRLRPLRERPEDLLPLARHLASSHGRSVSDSVGHLLRRYRWPGNVRELRHVISRAVAASESSSTLEPENFLEALDVLEAHRLIRGVSLAEEYRTIIEVCRRHEGRPEAIAAELRVSRATLFRRLREAGLSLKDLTPGRGDSLSGA